MKRLIIVAWVALFAIPAHATLKIAAWTLDNGARVLFVENHSIPMLDVSVEFDAGSRRDPQGKSGTASLTNAMLGRGLQAGTAAQDEPALTEAQISDGFADIAAQRGGSVGEDSGGVSLRTLSSAAERDAAVLLLARVLAQPSFPADFFARDKARTIAGIKEALTKPEFIASRAFSRVMYGSHPYAMEPTVASVEAVTREDLATFHRQHYVGNRAVIAMIGDITRAEADAIARQLTARLPQGAPLPPLPAVAPLQGQEERIAHPASQSHILIGAPALARGDPDFFALTVGNYVLGGGGFVSRLMQEVREKRGLSYSVYSYFEPLAQPGPFQIGLQTSQAQTGQALKVARETLADYLRTGPTEKELQAAKDNLIGGFPLRIDNNRKILANIAVIGFYQLPLDYLDTWTANVAKVSRADIQAAFQRKVAVDKLATIIVGNAGSTGSAGTTK
ncbi:M16 family metallopeptidase [Noviherbaspirillum sedimenti]|uniref:Insulinase family protein n=1 Tax=Noviherbaspirillum sedimenti TaxID=2320865 RepID=A0A3A3GU93_9BURK|nr:pitrilysin family protein [Noviherbaspirillum sedimenti]RJG04550.1 insulinase family protein [Noviherbaspirillum sedimenti]